MDTHKNAPMTPTGRLRTVQAVVAGAPVAAVAARFGVDRKTVRKWLAWYGADGRAALIDRSSRPHRSPTAIARGVARRVITLRRRTGDPLDSEKSGMLYRSYADWKRGRGEGPVSLAAGANRCEYADSRSTATTALILRRFVLTSQRTFVRTSGGHQAAHLANPASVPALPPRIKELLR